MPTHKTAVSRPANRRKSATFARRAKPRNPQTQHLQLPLTGEAHEIYALYKACSAAQKAVWHATPDARNAAIELLNGQEREFVQKAVKIVERIIPQDPQGLQDGIAPGDLTTLFLLKTYGCGHFGVELRNLICSGFREALFGAAGIKSDDRFGYGHRFPEPQS